MNTKRLIAIPIIMTMFVTSFAMAPEESHAAIPSKPAKVQMKGLAPSGYNALVPSWNKVSGADGYLVWRWVPEQRKWRAVIHLPKNYSVWKQVGLKSGTRYTYAVSAFKKYGIKYWYNKKTKKWQTAKPKKKWRGKSKTVYRHVYGNISAAKTASTNSAPLIRLGGLTASWMTYYTERGASQCVDVTWNGTAAAIRYNVYINGKIVDKTTTSYSYAIDTGSTNAVTVGISAVNKAGREGYRTSVVLPSYGSGQNSVSGGGSTSGPVSGGGGTSSGSAGNYDNLPWYGTLSVPEDKNVTLKYGNATIHLGQVFNTTILNQLKAGATGGKTEKVTRKDHVTFNQYKVGSDGWSIPSTHKTKTVNQDVYMFDIGDYDNFLSVYVTGGRISRWITNRSDMGSSGGKTLRFGMLQNEFPSKTDAFLRAQCRFNALGVQKDALVMGGFRQDSQGSDARQDVDVEVEKRIGLHLINAYRAFEGSQPLKYNIYLAGRDMNGNDLYYTGTFMVLTTTFTYTNQRYGAQAHAESQYASRVVTDGVRKLTKGPVAGVDGLAGMAYEASNHVVMPIGINSGTGYLGEACLTVYADSPGHLGRIAYPNHEYIGIGMCNGYHTEHFSDVITER